MANIIDILPQNKVSSSDSVSSEKEVIKDKPSLFDSLLKDSLSQDNVSSSEEEKIQNNPSTKELSTVEDVEAKSVVSSDAKIVESEDVKKVEIKNQNTLLDRLLIESKNSISDTSENLDTKDSKISLFDSLVKNSLSTTNEANVVVDSNLQVDEKEIISQELNLLNVDEAKNSISDTSENSDTKDSKTSLFDSLLKDNSSTNGDVNKIKDGDVILNKEEITTVKNEITENLLDEKVILDVSKEATYLSNDKEKIVENTDTFASKDLKDSTLFSGTEKNVEKKSLMDLLIQKNIEQSKVINSDINNNSPIDETSSNDFLSNMYLGSQKNLVNNQLLFNKSEALSLLKNGTSLNDIEKSADLLDLGLENIDITQDLEIPKMDILKSQNIDLLSRKNLLDNLLNEKNVRSEDIKNLITTSIEASKALIDDNLNLPDDVTVNVNSPLNYNIQSRIIGAKQQMSTMMSDIARQMYENYKPPVTVFKINLNPLDLGSIAIMMKSDRNNSLTISMNISNNTTLDTFVDNQNVLRNSLNKTFNEDTTFNLDFSSSNQNSNQSSNQNNEQSRRFENQTDTGMVLRMKEENRDREEQPLDYM